MGTFQPNSKCDNQSYQMIFQRGRCETTSLKGYDCQSSPFILYQQKSSISYCFSHRIVVSSPKKRQRVYKYSLPSVSLLFLLWVRHRRQKSFNNLNCLVIMLYIKNIMFFGTIQNQMFSEESGSCKDLQRYGTTSVHASI